MKPKNTWRIGRRIGPMVVGAGLLGAAALGCNNSESLMGMIAATPATTSGDYSRPFDTVPSSDASTFYFTALSGAGIPGVYSVPAMGGAATAVASGPPLVSPFGIAISSDDKTLYVADASGGYDPNDPAGNDNVGVIFSLPVGGGMPTPVGGTAGTRPRSLHVVGSGGNDTLWFTGENTSGGGVFNIPAGGGSATPVVAGPPLMDPSGLAVLKNGDAYVVNTTEPTSGMATVYKISNGMATPYASNLAVGYPAGAALSQGESVLLVSGRDPQLASDVVFTVKLDGSMTVGMVNMGIAQNTDSGGLHRAAGSNVFSWSDLTAGGNGTVYRIELH